MAVEPSALAPGSRLGPYHIVAPLGAGGMGEVFRATDSRLERQVALKLLPTSLARDAERMARFEREARVLASLNHPNIAGLHGIEESEGRKALVMELVEGEDLSARIERGPLPLDEALHIAVQIARALEAAHQKGITHRDLKPSNIRLTPDGTVKVLDFGLAKPTAPDASSSADARLSQSPTFTYHATQVGVVLGTAAYMSPEQARGRAVDSRSDVFSFGCILFEMLSGAHAFAGEDISEILASVIKGDVQWSLMPDSVPAPLRVIIRRCMELRPDERYQAIGDARIDLARLAAEPSLLAPVSDAAPGAASGAAHGLSWRAAGALALGALLAGGAIVFALRPAPRTASTAAAEVRFFLDEAPREAVAISPDARWLAWEVEGGVRVRRLDETEPRTLAVPWAPRVVGFSGDGRNVILQRTDETNGELWRLPVEGGEPQLITRLPTTGFLWGRVEPRGDELLIPMANAGIYSVPVRGGTPAQFLAPENGMSYGAPCLLPGADAFLFSEVDSGRILLHEGGRSRVVLELPGERIFDPMYHPSGHLLVRMTGGESQAGTWAVPFSLRDRKVTGAPFLAFPYGWARVADDGTIALRPMPLQAPPRRLVWVDRSGAIVGTIGAPIAALRTPRLSPDGRRIAATGLTADAIERGRSSDLFLVDVSSGATNVLRDDRGREYAPCWSEDGTKVRFTTWNAGVRRLRERSADGSGGVRDILESTFAVRSNHHGQFPTVFRFGPNRVETLEANESEGRRLLDGRITSGEVAPDGRFFAYTTPRDAGIQFRRYESPEGLAASVPGRADDLTWSWDGREVIYWSGDSVMVVSVTPEGDGLRPGTPRLLFDAKGRDLLSGIEYDVAPDGRLLMIQNVKVDGTEPKDPGILVVQNWAPRR